MRQRLPRANGRQVIRALERIGFRTVRIRGSHHHMAHEKDPSRMATFPIHGAKILSLSVMRNIIRTSRITVEELTEHL